MLRIFALVLVLLPAHFLFSSSVIELPYRTSDIEYSPVRDKLYALIDEMDVEYGNHLAELNPVTGAVERTVFVGSMPSKMRLTTDENYAWISFNAIPFVKRVDLNSFTVDKKVYLGPSIQYSSYERNSQILSTNFTGFENENNTLAIGLSTAFVFDYEGIVLYRDDTIQPVRVPDISYVPACLEPVLDNTYLVGHKQTSTKSVFTTMNVLENGLEVLEQFEGLIEANGQGRRNWFKMHNDTLFVAEGMVIDATDVTNLEVVGTCSNDVIGDRYGFTFSELHDAYIFPNLTGDSVYLTLYDKHTSEAYDSLFIMEYPHYQLVMLLELEVINSSTFSFLIGKDYGLFDLYIVDVLGSGTVDSHVAGAPRVFPNPTSGRITSW
jgi:hypothetical protein